MKTVASVLAIWLDMSFGPKSGPNVVSRPQTLKSRNFLRLYDFIGFMSYS